jgi:flagellar motor switch protein FliN
MRVTVVAGSTSMTLSQARALKPGDVIRLDRAPDATVDIYFNGSKAAVGDVIVVDDHLAARINEISERSRG